MTESSDVRDCPFCGEEIKKVAIKCKHCQSAIPGPAGVAATKPLTKADATDSTLSDQIKEAAVQSVALLKDSWLLSFKQFFPLLGAWALSLGGPVLLLFLGTTIGAVVDKMMFGLKHGGPVTLIGLLIPGFLIGCFWGGWINVTLQIARGLPVRFHHLFRPVNQILSCLAVLCITSVCIGVGSMIFVVPGFLLTLKWQLAPYYVIEHNYGPIQAMKQSWQETNRLFIPLCILDLFFAGLASIGTAIIVGPILCHMALGVASALAYSKWAMEDDLDELEMTA